MTQAPSLSNSTYWTWRGYPIHYVRAGTGSGIPFLLIHGFGASTDHWRKNINELAHHRPVFAIDLLGFGRSHKPDIVYTGELWRDQLRDFCTEIIGSPVIVAGNSLGGYAALVLTVDHPESVDGLVLLNGAGPFSDSREPSVFQELLGNLTRGLFAQSWASWTLFQYFRQRSVIRRTLEQVYLDKSAVTDQLVEDIYRPSCDPGAASVFAAVFQSPRGRNVDVLLEQLRRPLLLLWGEADPWMTGDRARRFVQAYPAARLEFIRAGHCPHDERPELVNRYLLDWSAELPGTRQA